MSVQSPFRSLIWPNNCSRPHFCFALETVIRWLWLEAWILGMRAALGPLFASGHLEDLRALLDAQGAGVCLQDSEIWKPAKL